MTIKIGETIPYCEIPATSQLTFSPKAYQGKKLVLYFYPKDSTPGCTVEAGEFRDHIDSFNQANALNRFEGLTEAPSYLIAKGFYKKSGEVSKLLAMSLRFWLPPRG